MAGVNGLFQRGNVVQCVKGQIASPNKGAEFLNEILTNSAIARGNSSLGQRQALPSGGVGKVIIQPSTDRQCEWINAWVWAQSPIHPPDKAPIGLGEERVRQCPTHARENFARCFTSASVVVNGKCILVVKGDDIHVA